MIAVGVMGFSFFEQSSDLARAPWWVWILIGFGLGVVVVIQMTLWTLRGHTIVSDEELRALVNTSSQVSVQSPVKRQDSRTGAQGVEV